MEYIQYGRINRIRDNVKLQTKEKPLYHHMHNLSYTASGYGHKIPTRYIVRLYNRWYRVYSMIYGNSGSLYIIVKKQIIFIDDYNLEL